MMKKKIVSLVLALMLCLSCVSALAAEAWTVTCPWAPSGVAAMVNHGFFPGKHDAFCCSRYFLLCI